MKFRKENRGRTATWPRKGLKKQKTRDEKKRAMRFNVPVSDTFVTRMDLSTKENQTVRPPDASVLS